MLKTFVLMIFYLKTYAQNWGNIFSCFKGAETFALMTFYLKPFIQMQWNVFGVFMVRQNSCFSNILTKNICTNAKKFFSCYEAMLKTFVLMIFYLTPYAQSRGNIFFMFYRHAKTCVLMTLYLKPFIQMQWNVFMVH